MGIAVYFPQFNYYNLHFITCLALRLFIDLTPCVPLSLIRRGGLIYRRGADVPLKHPCLLYQTKERRCGHRRGQASLTYSLFDKETGLREEVCEALG